MGEVIIKVHARKTYNQWIRKATRYGYNCPKAHHLATKALIFRDEGEYVKSEKLLAEAKETWYDAYLKYLRVSGASNYARQGPRHALKKLKDETR
jgi:uncharacterized protein HemY